VLAFGVDVHLGGDLGFPQGEVEGNAVLAGTPLSWWCARGTWGRLGRDLLFVGEILYQPGIGILPEQVSPGAFMVNGSEKEITG